MLPEKLLSRAEYVSVDWPKSYRRNARRHTKRQLRNLETGIVEFGFIVPILVDADGNVIAGHARLMVAKKLGMTDVPVIFVTHLTPAQVRAFRIADNRLAELAEWDETMLAIELQGLIEIDYNVEVTGFETPEIDLVISKQIAPIAVGPSDVIPDIEDNKPAVTRLGDVWRLGDHRLGCGDARDASIYEDLMNGASAQMVITDPPYNVRIRGNVCGTGLIQHREFVMGSGEMSDEEYEAFLASCVRLLVRFSQDGSVHFLFIDWRHLHILEAVCRRYYPEQLNLCVWAKTNGGMGSLYRSQHELVVVFKNGTAVHINNVQLGKYERNRTNVWRYEGVNTINPDRRGELALHPTVKPVALVADAIRDCSKRNGIVLDPFVGSGTTIIAAEETGRRCHALELDPRYVDVAIRRWQELTGHSAVHTHTNLTFDETSQARRSELLLLPSPQPHPKEG
ncbi:MAG TPA: DNA methyltransferase [Hyphomicrobiaceae bacterium]|nr:DNA methyltransferase [Hyphomicrobiaceae bacterium]